MPDESMGTTNILDEREHGQEWITLLPFIKALSDMTFSESLKIMNKVKKIGATMRIHSKWNLYL
jgi:hypothetical protein